MQLVSEIKKKCQVFTPDEVVDSMLDLAGYTNDIYGKSVLENSFGDGAFLVAIAKRYIESGLKFGRTLTEIAAGLSRDIVGYEVDNELVTRAKSRLDAVAQIYGIGDVAWDLRVRDALFDTASETFSFIVGNPPYLEYKMMMPAYREALKSRFSSCRKGKFDYCYAFVEYALEKLSSDGVLVQLIPNSVFKNVYASNLRKLLKPGITDIIDYSAREVFNQVLVSPCVFKFEANKASQSIRYSKIDGDRAFSISKDELDGKWSFVSLHEDDNRRSFGDYFHASSSVATLNNTSFLINSPSCVENDLVFRAVSPRTARKRKAQYIIFPYRVCKDGSIQRYTLREFEELFPRACQHLKSHGSELKARHADKSALWFEYGRSQGLFLVPKKKLLISTVVTGRVNVYELEENVVPYAGIVITARDFDGKLAEAKEILESDDFLAYAQHVGTSVSGVSVRITSRDVNSYRY